MLTEIDKRIAENKAKKEKEKEAKRKAKLGIEEEPEDETVSMTINNIITEEVNKAKVAYEIKQEEVKQEIKKIEAPKPKQTKEEIKQQKLLIKEEKKKAKKAKKKEYDRLRNLEIKAKKLEAQAKSKAITTEQPKPVEKLETAVDTFKEEVEEYVEDLEIDQDDLARQLAEMDNIIGDDDEEEEEEEEADNGQDEEIFNDEEPIISVRADYLKKYREKEPFSFDDIPQKQLNHAKEFVKYDYLIEELSKAKLRKGANYRHYLNSASRGIIQAVAEDKGDSRVPAFRLYRNSKKTGKGFNKKQLRQIILDKNKVIKDLEETAYGGNYNQHSYLDNILDNNTTSQNIIIHREHFNSVPKYIKTLVGD
jgi:hypothetical protein